MVNCKLLNCKIKLVVLDDDPTGIQTVHGCKLITDWSESSVRMAFDDDVPFFYILTNTRAMTREDAERVMREAMEMVVRVNEDYHLQLVCVSRSDSCLRGHFPLEPQVMMEVLTQHGYHVRKQIPFVPAFIEAGRVTIDGVHYMKDGERLVPVSETEFARDNVFAYHTSVLKDYILEKGAQPNDYQIVNAASYNELYTFCTTLEEELATATHEKEAVVVRSSSSFPKAMSGIADRPLLDRTMLKRQEGVGCFVVGSHVNKTTRQLKALLAEKGTKGVEVDVLRILHEPDAMMQDVVDELNDAVGKGLTPVVYTSRKELRIDDANQRQHLGQQVSDFLVDIVRHLPFTPTYLVGKGGITSNDILTKGLSVRIATVMGQIVANVPCVMTDRFPYIIFPGNVGNDDSLREVFLKLTTNSH